MKLEGKKIIVISPQAWGKMFVAKHHYAVELAKRGNEVYFLNPPNQKEFVVRSKVTIESLPEFPNLRLVNHKLFFPYILKFHLPRLYHYLMGFHIKTLEKKLGGPFDIIWSFDLGYVYGLKEWSNKSYKIYHPIDEPTMPESWDASQTANILFSVTHEILQKFEAHPAPKYFINHGISEGFVKHANPDRPINHPIKVGLSGNLTRTDIDRPVMIQIIKENPDIQFNFWGAYQFSNLGGGTDPETVQFIEHLKSANNVILHGPVSQNDLAVGLNQMDAFLIVYDVEKDQSKGTNYHKVMEYLSTGRPVISNNITTYQTRPDLIFMVESRTSNEALPHLFKQILEKINEQFTPEKINTRVQFAQSNLYQNQIDLIEEKINSNIN